MAVEHLIETGRRRIAFVGGPFDIRQVNDRLAGARVAAENASPPLEIEVIATGAMTVEEGAAAGTRILARPRRDWPDALFAANDLLALGLLQSLIVDGRMLVPHEIAIIGFDDIPLRRGRCRAAVVDAPAQSHDRPHCAADPPRGGRRPVEHRAADRLPARADRAPLHGRLTAARSPAA